MNGRKSHTARRSIILMHVYVPPLKEQGEGVPASGIEVPTAELGSIKDRFETGDAFKGQETGSSFTCIYLENHFY